MSDELQRWHPARPDDDGDGLAVDLDVTVEGWQVTPASWDAVAAWCNGVQVWNPRGVALGSFEPDRVAQLGDYVMRTKPGYAGFEVSRADGHHQQWQPAQ